MTHSQSQETISFSSSFCGGQLWMSWGFPHMELKKHHHHHIIYFSHSGIQNRHLVPPITVRVLCQMSWNGLRHILISWKLSILSWVRRGILAADCGFFVCDVCLDLMASLTPLPTNGMNSILHCDQWETHLADSCMGRDEMCLVFLGVWVDPPWEPTSGMGFWVEKEDRDRLQVYRAAINNQIKQTISEVIIKIRLKILEAETDPVSLNDPLQKTVYNWTFVCVYVPT